MGNGKRLVAIVAAYLLYNWGLEEVPASVAVSAMNLGEAVTWVQVAGGAVVIAGVMFSAHGA